MTNSNQPPAETLRDGNIKATIWENEGEKGPFFAVTIAKTYTDRDGNLRDTQSFSGTDLLRVAELSRAAYARTNELRQEFRQEAEQDQAPVQHAEHSGARSRARTQTRRPQR